MVGHMLSSCDRVSIGGKSPLAGGVKEANAGGRTGLQLALLGVKALIIEDQSQGPDWWVLHVSAEGVRFDKGDEYAGKGVYETAPMLFKRYGDDVAVAPIGPSGEMCMLAAGIQNVDKDGTPSRIAARGGLGALMGSKGIKAIVVDGSSGDKPPLADGDAFKQARKDYNKALLEHPQTAIYRDYGTAAMTMLTNAYGVLPTRNFSEGQFEDAEKLSGEHVREVMLGRGKSCDPSHACMTGCIIQSSNMLTTEDGSTTVSPIEYETLGMIGSNLGLTNVDEIARANYLLNDLGLDTIEIGAALGMAAESGQMEFGDGDRVLELIE